MTELSYLVLPVYLLNISIYASLFAIELEKLTMNDDIRASCPTMSPKNESNVTNNKNEF